MREMTPTPSEQLKLKHTCRRAGLGPKVTDLMKKLLITALFVTLRRPAMLAIRWSCSWLRVWVMSPAPPMSTDTGHPRAVTPGRSHRRRREEQPSCPSEQGARGMTGIGCIRRVYEYEDWTCLVRCAAGCAFGHPPVDRRCSYGAEGQRRALHRSSVSR